MFDGLVKAAKKVGEAVKTSDGAAATSHPPTTGAAARRAAGGDASSSNSSKTSSASTGSSSTRSSQTAPGSRSTSSTRATNAAYSSGADSVTLTADTEDEEPATREADGRTAEAPADEVYVRGDGTVVEVRDGRTTTREPNGTVTETYREGDTTVTDTRYEREGAQVRETERRAANGDVRTVSEVSKDGRTETTVSETTHSDKTIEELRGVCLRGERGVDADLVRDGERQPTEITTVRQTVTDTTKNPPETTEVLSRTTYSQHIPLGDRDPEATGLSTDALHERSRHRRGMSSFSTTDGVDLDREQSGVTLAYTTTTVPGEDGKPQTTTEMGATKTLVGRKDGRDVQITEAQADTWGPDGTQRSVDSREFRGIYAKGGDARFDVTDVGGIGEKGDYVDRLEDGPLNYRETSSYTVEANGERKLDVRTQEYGDYDNPQEPGRSVVITEDDDKKFWTYNRTDATDTGVRVQSQTSLQGSQAHILSDTTINRDGTGRSETRQVNHEGATTRIETRERRLADESDRHPNGTLFVGDQGYATRFAEETRGRDVYVDEVSVVDSADVKNSYTLKEYSAEGSNDKISVLTQTGNLSTTTVYEDPDSETPARMRINGGDEILLGADDKVSVLGADGERVDLGSIAAGEGPGATGMLKSSASATRKLYGALNNLGARELADLADNHPRLAGALSTIGLVINGNNLVRGLVDGDAGAVLGGAAGGSSALGELSSLGSKVLSASRLTSALKVGGRALGAAGAVLGVGYGLYQMSQGDTVQGAFSVAAGLGSGLAVGASIAGASAWVPVAGWAVAGVAVVGGLVYDLWSSHNEEHQTKDLQF